VNVVLKKTMSSHRLTWWQVAVGLWTCCSLLVSWCSDRCWHGCFSWAVLCMSVSSREGVSMLNWAFWSIVFRWSRIYLSRRQFLWFDSFVLQDGTSHWFEMLGCDNTASCLRRMESMVLIKSNLTLDCYNFLPWYPSIKQHGVASQKTNLDNECCKNPKLRMWVVWKFLCFDHTWQHYRQAPQTWPRHTGPLHNHLNPTDQYIPQDSLTPVRIRPRRKEVTVPLRE